MNNKNIDLNRVEDGYLRKTQQYQKLNLLLGIIFSMLSLPMIFNFIFGYNKIMSSNKIINLELKKYYILMFEANIAILFIGLMFIYIYVKIKKLIKIIDKHK